MTRVFKPVTLGLVFGVALTLGLLLLLLAKAGGPAQPASAAGNSIPSGNIGSTENWSVQLNFTKTSGPGLSNDLSFPRVFGVIPGCGPEFEEFSNGDECDLGRDESEVIQGTANFYYPNNPNNQFAGTQDETRLIQSRYSPGDGSLTSLTWPLRIELGTISSATAGTYIISFTWTSADIAAIPNDPVRQVELRDGAGNKLVDFRTGVGSTEVPCTTTTDGHSCQVTLVATSSVIKDFDIFVGEIPPVDPATAVIASPPTTTNEGQDINFSSAGSGPGNDATGTTLTFSWDFGDSSEISTETSPTYAYPDDSGTGSFTVTLTVTDNVGGVGTASAVIQVNNVAPTITGVTAIPNPVNEGASTTITVNATDPAGDNDPLTYSFDCNGDGDFTDSGEVSGQSTNSHPCTFPDDSVHTVNVSVDDGDTGVTTSSVDVTVNNVAPFGIVIASPDTVNEGGTVSIIASFTDPAGTNDPLTYSFDCNGDGDFTDDGDVADKSTNSHPCTFPDDSVHTVNVTVADDDGGSTPASVDVTVNNVAPVITSVTATPDVHNVAGDSTITVTASDVAADLPLGYFFSCDGDDVYEIGPKTGDTTAETTAVCTFSGNIQGPNTVKVKVQDKDGGEGFGTVIVNVGAPAIPSLIFPVNDTTPALTIFRWIGDALSERYTLEIDLGTGNFTPPVRTIPVTHQGTATAEQSHTLTTPLDTGKWYIWRIKATSDTTTLSSDFSQPASFVTSGAQGTLTLQVTLQGTGTPATTPKFDVKLYSPDTSRDPNEPPWAIFGETPISVFSGTTGTPDGTDPRLFTISISDVTTGFYDITIESDHTLVNLKDDAKVYLTAGAIDMGTLKEGNAVNDPRVPAVELSTIINALDASALAAELSKPKVTDRNPNLDFNRDGSVTADDLTMLQGNYLEFSPILVP